LSAFNEPSKICFIVLYGHKTHRAPVQHRRRRSYALTVSIYEKFAAQKSGKQIFIATPP
jgi:hypothetical protein